MKSGTGFLTLGTATTIWLFDKLGDGATILTAVVLIGFEVSSDTDLISAEKLYTSSSLFLLI
jgi:hypothetical protein